MSKVEKISRLNDPILVKLKVLKSMSSRRNKPWDVRANVELKRKEEFRVFIYTDIVSVPR